MKKLKKLIKLTANLNDKNKCLRWNSKNIKKSLTIDNISFEENIIYKENNNKFGIIKLNLYLAIKINEIKYLIPVKKVITNYNHYKICGDPLIFDDLDQVFRLYFSVFCTKPIIQ